MTDDYTYETCHNSDTHEQMQLTIHCATHYTTCYTAHYKQNQYGSKNNNYSFHDNQFFRMLMLCLSQTRSYSYSSIASS